MKTPHSAHRRRDTANKRVLRFCVALWVCSFLLLSPGFAEERAKPEPLVLSDVPWADSTPDSKLIYGTDDRIEAFEETDPLRRLGAKSTCALVRAERVGQNGDGSYYLDVSANQQLGLPACPDEPFGNQPVAAFCTGFMVGEDLIATAGHCYSSADLAGTYFIFGFEMLDASTAATDFDSSQVYQGVEVVGRQLGGDYDYTVLRTDRPITAPGAVPLPLRREGEIPLGARVGVIGHPSGLPLKLAFGDTTVVRDNTNDGFFVANLDTYHGNSGSPVFNAITGEVEGILVRGDIDYVSHGDCFVSNVMPDNGGRGEDISKTLTFSEFVPETLSSMARITLGSPALSCSGTLSVTLSDADLAGAESVFVAVHSNNGDAENGFLAAQADRPGWFSGSISAIEGTPIPGDGLLEVANGDAVMVSYWDADSGQGHPTLTTATVYVDCVAPVIAGVAIVSVNGSQALVVFNTNEITTGSIRYGTAYDALTQVQQGTRNFGHGIRLNGLLPETTYAFIVEAEDDAGNLSTDDNGGACYFFTTTLQTDYFTEQFTAGENDLEFRSFTFFPLDNANGYSLCQTPSDAFESDPAGSTALSLGDDDFALIPLSEGHAVYLYGVPYEQVFVGSNGYLTFGFGDKTYAETLSSHFALPRISLLFDDLTPPARGEISWKELSDRLVITYHDVPEYDSSGAYLPANSNSFQAELFFDGVLRLTYLGVSARDGLAGLSAGRGYPMDFVENNLSNSPDCAVLDSDHDSLPDAEEVFTHGTNPVVPDSDSDGITDGWEVQFGLDPLHSADASGDIDNDGLNNFEEFEAGTLPNRADSDRDGIDDATEIAQGTDPTGAEQRHSADTNQDWRISLSEALRVIQLYNSRGYHCQSGTEDGFAPGTGSQDCVSHNSDYLNADYRISLSELLRLIQIFIAGTYERDLLGEDGFSPVFNPGQ